MEKTIEFKSRDGKKNLALKLFYAEEEYSDELDLAWPRMRKTDVKHTARTTLYIDGREVITEDAACFSRVFGLESPGILREMCEKIGAQHAILIGDALHKKCIVGLTDEAVELYNRTTDELVKAGACELTKETWAKFKAEQIADAKAVVKRAETTVKNPDGTLMTIAQAAQWKKNCNRLHNEGGSGFVAGVITQELYDNAVRILKDSGAE